MYELTSKTTKGFIWSFFERFSLQGVQFFIGVVLARMLSPSDFGLIGLLTVFISVSQIFIDSGFSSSLIQSKDVSQRDYGTVFCVNVVIGIIAYAILFLIAPFIASFYEIDELRSILRIQSLVLVLNSFYAVQQIRLNKDVNFKTLSKCSLISAIISGLVGFYFAYNAYGVWSLVYQTLTNSIAMFFSLTLVTKWFPYPCFDKKSFNRLFGFGSKILLSSLIHTVYVNLYSIVIGKIFSTKELGFFNRAEQIGLLPSNNVAGVISRVAYPTLSGLQDDEEGFKSAFLTFLKLSCFIIFPLTVGLCVLAYPAILVVFGEKWLGTTVLLQILCIGFIFDPICSANINLLNAKGRSDLVLKLEIIKKSLATTILFISIPFGVLGICIGRALYSVIAVFLNMKYTKRIINISVYNQIRVIVPELLLSIIMAFVVLEITALKVHPVCQLIAGCVGGFFTYVGLAYILKMDSFKILMRFFKAS